MIVGRRGFVDSDCRKTSMDCIIERIRKIDEQYTKYDYATLSKDIRFECREDIKRLDACVDKMNKKYGWYVFKKFELMLDYSHSFSNEDLTVFFRCSVTPEKDLNNPENNTYEGTAKQYMEELKRMIYDVNISKYFKVNTSIMGGSIKESPMVWVDLESKNTENAKLFLEYLGIKDSDYIKG